MTIAWSFPNDLAFPDQPKYIFHTVSDVFRDYLVNKGISLETTPAYTPEYNRVAERYNQTIMVMVHSLLADRGLPSPMWGEALRMANILNNHLPTHTNKGHKTPFELWTGHEPDYKHLWSLGAVCLSHTKL